MNRKVSKSLIFSYILSAIIPMIVVFIAFLAGSYAPFGGKNVLSAGGFSEYLPYYYELYDRVHEGQSLVYSITLGNGYDFTALCTYYLSDPLNYIILLFSRNSIIAVLNILYMIKVGFAGFSMSFYLNSLNRKLFSSTVFDEIDGDKKNFIIGGKGKPKSDILKAIYSINWILIAFSVSYAISTPMITKGLNVSLLGPMALFPLVIYGVDRLLSDKNSILLILFLSASIISNMYISLITCLVVFIYFCTRKFDNLKYFLNSFVRLILSYVVSFMIPGVIVINNINSSFWKDNISNSFPVGYFSNPLNSFKQLLSHSTLSQFSLYNVSVDVSFGVIFLFILLVGLFSSKYNIYDKIRSFILLFLLFCGTFFSTANYLFSGCNYTSFNHRFYLFTFVFFSISISYNIFEKIIECKSANIAIPIISLICLIIGSMIFSDMYDSSKSFIYSIEFLFMYFIFTLILVNKSINKHLYTFIIGVLIFVEIVPISVDNLTKEGKSFYSQSIEHTNSMKIYETTRYIHQKDSKARIYYVNRNKRSDTPLTNSFNGYDYIIQLGDNGLIDSNLEFIEQYQPNIDIPGVFIYRNKTVVHGLVLKNNAYTYDYSVDYPFSSANVLSEEYLNGNTIFEMTDMINDSELSLDQTQVKFNIVPASPGMIYVKTYYVSYLGNINQKKTIETVQDIPIYMNRASNYIYQSVVFNDNNFNSLVNSLNTINSYIFLDKKTSIKINHDSYISTNYPAINSLVFKIDGKKVQAHEFINDNSIIPVSSGDNSVEIYYTPIYLVIGSIVSILGIFVFIMLKKKINIELNRNDYNVVAEKIVKNISNNQVYYISLLIFSFVMLICFMVSNSIPFGKASNVGGDGLSMTYTSFVAMVKMIKNHRFFPYFNFNLAGFNEVYSSTYLNVLLHPWIIIKYSIFPESYCLFDFNLEYFLYSALSIFSIVFYLTHRHNNRLKKYDKRLIPIALAYSLSSYALEFYSYKAGFLYLPMLPLIILGLEQLVYNKKGSLYICVLTIMMTYEAYHTFLLCEFIVLFFFLFDFDSIKDFINKGVRFALSSVVAACISSFYLVTYFGFVSNSPYLLNDKRPSFYHFFGSYIQILANLQVGNSNGVVSKDNSKAIIYMGLFLTFVAIPLYIVCNKIPRKNKVKRIALIFLLFFSFNNELFNYILHGFHFQTLVPNRFAAFLLFLITISFADVIAIENNFNQLKYVVTTIIVYIGVVILFINSKVETFTLLSIVLIGIYISFIIFAYIKKLNFVNVLLVLMCMELLINSIFVFPKNNGEIGDLLIARDVNNIVKSVPDMKRFDCLSEYLGEDNKIFNLGNSSDINSLSYFSNSLDSNIINLLSYYNLPISYNNLRYRSGNPLADMMTRVRYHIENRYDMSAFSIYNKVYSYKNYCVYENPYYLPMGLFISEYNNKLIKNTELPQAFEYQNLLSQSLGGEDIYTIIDLDEYNSSKEQSNYYDIVKQYGVDEVNNEENSFTEFLIHVDAKEGSKVYASVSGAIFCIGEITETNNNLYLDYPGSLVQDKTFKPEIAILNEENMMNLHDILAEHVMTNVSEDSRCIYGEINAPKSGELYISLPYSDCWTIYVDDNIVKQEKFLGGMGIKVPEGKHHIVMKYTPKYIILGLSISVFTIIFIIIFQLLKHRKKL